MWNSLIHFNSKISPPKNGGNTLFPWVIKCTVIRMFSSPNLVPELFPYKMGPRRLGTRLTNSPNLLHQHPRRRLSKPLEHYFKRGKISRTWTKSLLHQSGIAWIIMNLPSSWGPLWGKGLRSGAGRFCRRKSSWWTSRTVARGTIPTISTVSSWKTRWSGGPRGSCTSRRTK